LELKEELIIEKEDETKD